MTSFIVTTAGGVTVRITGASNGAHRIEREFTLLLGERVTVEKGVVMNGTLTATRTHRVTGDAREVELTWEVRAGHDGEPWLYVKPGVTGYESVKLDDYHKPLLRVTGWHACAGTRMVWDALFIPVNEMRRVLDEIERKDFHEQREDNPEGRDSRPEAPGGDAGRREPTPQTAP